MSKKLIQSALFDIEPYKVTENIQDPLLIEAKKGFDYANGEPLRLTMTEDENYKFSIFPCSGGCRKKIILLLDPTIFKKKKVTEKRWHIRLINNINEFSPDILVCSCGAKHKLIKSTFSVKAKKTKIK